MNTIDDAFLLAVYHQQNGRNDAAQHIYRLIIEVQPGHPAALNNLGLMLAPADAEVMFLRAVAAEPDYVDALVNLSSALQARGAFSDAAIAFERALRLIPEQPETLFRLGHVLHTQGRTSDAAAQYKRALQLKPDFPAALCNLGILHTEAARQTEAAGYYQRALASDPTLAVASLNLVSILESEGRLAEAKRYRSRIARPQALVVEAAPEHRRTVLILANTFVGNIPLDTILPSRTNTRITWHVEFATPAQAENLPPYDVAFNAIGNADVLDESFDCVSAFASHHRLLNSPQAVAHTRRDRLPQLLGGIPGVVVPRTLRLARADIEAGNLVSRLDEAGIPCPVLVRPIAGHGGEGMQLVWTPQQLATFVPGAADAYYLAAFHDCRLDDGFHRKYRVIFVDRVPFAYHLAISDRWLVHYFSAAMMSAPWKRDEEQRFLADPRGVLGPEAWSALVTIGLRLDLDFAGIDFAVLPDGRLLVFEANATMLVHLRDSVADFPYKHAHIPKILEAVDAMLDHHASLAPIP